ncbi:hypothetical protein EVAR_20663_1 [Eumeta japonica]|uniref:Mariner Mos1 transposase n=1 Tax=Eumeta variegata TaxID=151549 RepID=A0A4C1VC07_EUMVA|nr:hypothetical protein EVAR_20663_1 [Eumeta japonica]
MTDDLEGRPSKATTEDDISAVRLRVETDNRVTYQQIRTSLGIGMSQVHIIFYEYLAAKKLCTRELPSRLDYAFEVQLNCGQTNPWKSDSSREMSVNHLEGEQEKIMAAPDATFPR